MSDPVDETEQDAPLYAGQVRSGVLGIACRAMDDDEDSRKQGRSAFIASTDTVDRMGDVVEQGWRLAAWRKNPVILLDHTPTVVGRGLPGSGVRSVEGGGKRLEIQVQWDVGDHNPAGTLVAAQHARGFRNAGSVGFRPAQSINRKDLPEGDPRRVAENVDRWLAGYVHRSPELLEFSSVAVPANPDATQLRSLWASTVQDPTEDRSTLLRVLRELTPADTAAMILAAVRQSDEIRTAIRACLLDAPAPARPVTTSTPGDWLADLGIP